ncbi:MAG: carboxypeptidase regulatory-like domain-containing protein, partial [bacterium]
PDMALSTDFLDETNRGQIISNFAQSLGDAHQTFRDQLIAAGASPSDIAKIMRQIGAVKMKKEFLTEKSHYEGANLTTIEDDLADLDEEISMAEDSVLGTIPFRPSDLGLQDVKGVLDAAKSMSKDEFIDKLKTNLQNACPTCDTSLINLMESVGEAQELLDNLREIILTLMPPETIEGELPVPPPLKIIAGILNIDWSIIEANMKLVRDAELKLKQAINDPSIDPNMAKAEFERTIKNVRDALLTTYVGITYEGITSIENQLLSAANAVQTALENGAFSDTVMETFHTAVETAFANLDTLIPEKPNNVTITAEEREHLIWAVREVFMHTTVHLPPNLLKPPDADNDGCPDFVEAETGACPKPGDIIPPDVTLTDSDGDGYPDVVEEDYGTDPDDPDSTPENVAGTDPVYCIALMGADCPQIKPSDGVDNDGDGEIDEELLDGIDNDEDGMIDEDTAAPDDIPLSTVSGKIIYNGNPVGNAYAGLYFSSDFMNDYPVNIAGPTGDNGAFEMFGVYPGMYYIAGFQDNNNDGMPTLDCDSFGFYGKEITDPSTGKKNFVPISFEVPFGETEITIDEIVVVKVGDASSTECQTPTVTDFGKISGTVKKSDGTGIKDAKVGVMVPAYTNFKPVVVPMPVLTDASGNYTISEVPVGTWEVVAYIPQSTSGGTGEVVRLSEIATVEKNETATVNFILFDDTNICMIAAECPAGAFRNYECDCVCEMGLKPVFDAAGDLTKCEEPPATCDLACTGEHQVLLPDICMCGCEKGYTMVMMPMTDCGAGIDCGSVAPVTDMCVGPVGALGGRVTDASGKSVPGANISLGCTANDADTNCEKAFELGFYPPMDIYTDSEGKFSIGALPAGVWDVKAVHMQMSKYGVATGVVVKMAEQTTVSIKLDKTIDNTVCPPDSGYDATLKTCVFACPEGMSGDMACYMLWAPVCGWSETNPKETYSNDCVACTSGKVQHYIKGECPAAATGAGKKTSRK